jgi:hypothetical protein
MLTRRSLFFGLALVFAVVAATVVVVTASSSQRAEARCSGSTPVQYNRYNGSGVLVGAESVTYPGTTCNGDAFYSGAVYDALGDGSCVTAYYLEVYAYYAAQGTACTTNAWSVYSYSDVYGPNSVLMSVRPTYLSDDWVTSSGY